eukprot:749121-Hanusia_phi.AAC.2
MEQEGLVKETSVKLCLRQSHVYLPVCHDNLLVGFDVIDRWKTDRRLLASMILLIVDWVDKRKQHVKCINVSAAVCGALVIGIDRRCAMDATGRAAEAAAAAAAAAAAVRLLRRTLQGLTLDEGNERQRREQQLQSVAAHFPALSFESSGC